MKKSKKTRRRREVPKTEDRLALAFRRKTLAQQKREHHQRCYQEQMVQLWRDADAKGRIKLAEIFRQETGLDLEQVVQARVIKYLKLL
jgi:hypothetical protein